MLKQSPPSSSVSTSAIILGCPSRSFWLPSNCKTCVLTNSVLQYSPKFSKWFTENELINIVLSFFKAIFESYLINLQNNLCRMHSNTVLIFRRNGSKPVMLYRCLYRGTVQRIRTGDGNSFSLSKGNLNEKCLSISEYRHFQLFSSIMPGIPHLFSLKFILLIFLPFKVNIYTIGILPILPDSILYSLLQSWHRSRCGWMEAMITF